MKPALDFVDVLLYAIFGFAGLGSAIVGILALTGYGSRWYLEIGHDEDLVVAQEEEIR